jgi:hypothetical protein
MVQGFRQLFPGFNSNSHYADKNPKGLQVQGYL